MSRSFIKYRIYQSETDSNKYLIINYEKYTIHSLISEQLFYPITNGNDLAIPIYFDVDNITKQFKSIYFNITIDIITHLLKNNIIIYKYSIFDMFPVVCRFKIIDSSLLLELLS